MDETGGALPRAVAFASAVVPDLRARADLRGAVDALALILVKGGAIWAHLFSEATLAFALVNIEEPRARALFIALALTSVWVLNKGWVARC